MQACDKEEGGDGCDDARKQQTTAGEVENRTCGREKAGQDNGRGDQPSVRHFAFGDQGGRGDGMT